MKRRSLNDLLTDQMRRRRNPAVSREELCILLVVCVGLVSLTCQTKHLLGGHFDSS